MAFLDNKPINWLNLHYAVNALARTGGDAFFCAFLLRAGLSAPVVLVALAAILSGRFLVRPAILPLAKRFGLRSLVIAGSLLVALEFPLLAQVRAVGPRLYALVALAAVADALYWTCYHAYFAALGDPESRGHQVGAREAIAAVAGIAGPLATGWSLVAFGPTVAFGATGLVLAASALPILATPPIAIAVSARGALRASVAGVRYYAVNGWISAGMYALWQIALFISLRENFAAFGGAVALAGLAGSISGLVLGRWIDRGHGLTAVWVSVGTLALVVVARAASFGHAAPAVIANAGGSVAAALYLPTLMTAVYNEAKLSPCPLRFQMAAEGGFDAGCAAAYLTAAALLWAGAPLGDTLLLPLAGAGIMAVMLARYYRGAALKPVATT